MAWTARPTARGAGLAAAWAAFAVLCVLPPLQMLARGFSSVVDIRLATTLLLLDERQRHLLWTTVQLGAWAAMTASAIGAPLGFLLARSPLPARRLLRALLTLPLLIPSYVLALAWVFATGPEGLLAALGVPIGLERWTYSLPATILVLGANLSPLSMLAVEAAARRIDGRLEEAGLLAAPRRRVLARITAPLVAPSAWAAALLVFVLAVSDFGAPSLLRVPVFTTEVFTAFAALYDFQRAASLAIPLLACALVAAVGGRVLLGIRPIAWSRPATPPLPVPLTLAKWPVLAWIGICLGFGLLVPVASLWFETHTLGSWSELLRGSGASILNSLWTAAVSATTAAALGALLGHAQARSSGRAAAASETLCVVLFAVPGTIIGVGLIGLWNVPGIAGGLYGTQVMIVLACAARIAPVAVLLMGAAARQIPRSTEEAAAVAGVGWLRTFARVVTPQLRPAIVAVWTVGFILGCGELGASVLVAPSGDATLPLRVYTLTANAPVSTIAALALLQVLVIATPLAALAVTSSRLT